MNPVSRRDHPTPRGHPARNRPGRNRWNRRSRHSHPHRHSHRHRHSHPLRHGRSRCRAPSRHQVRSRLQRQAPRRARDRLDRTHPSPDRPDRTRPSPDRPDRTHPSPDRPDRPDRTHQGRCHRTPVHSRCRTRRRPIHRHPDLDRFLRDPARCRCPLWAPNGPTSRHQTPVGRPTGPGVRSWGRASGAQRRRCHHSDRR